MKKIICLLLGLSLLMLLAGCTSQAPVNESAEETVNFAPENTAVPVENSSIQDAASAFSGGSDSQPAEDAAVQDVPAAIDTQPSAETESEDVFGSYSEGTEFENSDISRLDLSSINFSTMSDSTLGFTFNYPSHWINNPGVYTVCYREDVEPGDYPARVAVTRKKLTHTADSDGISDELKSYLKTIYKQYDAKTFEVGTLNKSIQFMGKKGFSTTYLAFSGETEVKGFVICAQIERTLYVFHFSASYDDFVAMENIIQYMCKSVKPITKK